MANRYFSGLAGAAIAALSCAGTWGASYLPATAARTAQNTDAMMASVAPLIAAHRMFLGATQGEWEAQMACAAPASGIVREGDAKTQGCPSSSSVSTRTE